MATENYYTVKYASISESASGSKEIVAAVSGSRIRVLHYTMVVAGAVDLKWQSASTDITGAMTFASKGQGVATPEVSQGVMETNSGEALNLNLSAGVAVNGHVTYQEIPE